MLCYTKLVVLVKVCCEMYSIKDIDISRLKRDYSKFPLSEDEYITKEEFGYLYLEVNLSFDEIDEYLQSKPGTALNKNRRKPPKRN